MHSSIPLASALLALSTLISALPQQASQSTAAVAFNPINGLPLPIAESTVTESAASSRPTTTEEDEDTESESASPRATITAGPTHPSVSSSPKSSTDTDSETDVESSSSDTESSSADPELIIWTDTAENTIYTMTRVTSTSTSEVPDPTIGVPPDRAHATVMVEITNAAGQEEIVPTRSVDTFVQAYTGAASPLLHIEGRKGKERVWWLLGLVGAVGLL